MCTALEVIQQIMYTEQCRSAGYVHCTGGHLETYVYTLCTEVHSETYVHYAL